MDTVLILCIQEKPLNGYSKTCHKRPIKMYKIKVLKTNGSLMKVESITECSPWSILQYFWPALSNNWSCKPVFGLLFEWQLKTGFTVHLQTVKTQIKCRKMWHFIRVYTNQKEESISKQRVNCKYSDRYGLIQVSIAPLRNRGAILNLGCLSFGLSIHLSVIISFMLNILRRNW